jgi:hypothetical protein
MAGLKYLDSGFHRNDDHNSIYVWKPSSWEFRLLAGC